MRTKFVRIVLLLGMLSLLGVSFASASSVTNSPGGATSGSAGTMLLRVGTLTLLCTGSSVSGVVSTSASGSFTAGIPDMPAVTVSSPLDNTTGNVAIGFSSCTWGAGVRFAVRCSGTSNTAVTGATVSGVTPLRITAIRCVITLTTGCTATLQGDTTAGSGNLGGVDGTYNNTGRLFVTAPNGTNQRLAIVSSTCTATIPNGTVQLSGSPFPTALAYAITPVQTQNAV
jgi:hypothetical protein